MAFERRKAVLRFVESGDRFDLIDHFPRNGQRTEPLSAEEERVLDDHARGGVGQVRKLMFQPHVAGRVNTAVGCLHEIIDVNAFFAVELHLGGFEVQVAYAGGPSGADQDFIRGDHGLVIVGPEIDSVRLNTDSLVR